jgi:hypothetical protein
MCELIKILAALVLVGCIIVTAIFWSELPGPEGWMYLGSAGMIMITALAVFLFLKWQCDLAPDYLRRFGLNPPRLSSRFPTSLPTTEA